MSQENSVCKEFSGHKKWCPGRNSTELPARQACDQKQSQEIRTWISSTTNYNFFNRQSLFFSGFYRKMHSTWPWRKTAVGTCNEEGTIVLKLPNNYCCWRSHNCGRGHILPDGLCGPRCPCPPWAQDCLIYHGNFVYNAVDVVKHLRIDFYNDDEPNYLPLLNSKPKFCSFEPGPKCASEPFHVKTSQVDLPNGKIFLVQNLASTRRQITPNNLTCLGDPEGHQTSGSGSFCHLQPCLNSSEYICFFDSFGIVLFIVENGNYPFFARESVPVSLCI